MQAKSDYDLATLEDGHEKNLSSLRAQFASEVSATRQLKDLMDEEKTELERSSAAAASLFRSEHSTEIARREAFYQSKIMEEVDRYSALSTSLDQLNADAASESARIAAAREKEIARAAAIARETRSAANARLAVLEARISSAARDLGENREQAAEDADEEVSALAHGYAERVRAERDISMRLKSENAVLTKKIGAASALVVANKAELVRRLARQAEASATVGSVEREIGLLKVAVNEKEDLMVEKEQRMSASRMLPQRMHA
jgi:hypothetical protein